MKMRVSRVRKVLVAIGTVLLLGMGSVVARGAGKSSGAFRTYEAPPSMETLVGAVSGHGEPLTAARAVRRWGLDELRFAPDRTRLVFSVGTPIEGPAFSSNLWLLEVSTRQLRQFTFSSSREIHPRWSPDGGRLAFLSNRSGSMQIHLAFLDGGEARQITSSPTSVESFVWSPDGRQIAFVAPEAGTEEERRREKEIVRFVDQYFYQTTRSLQVWVLDVESGESRQLTTSPWRIAHSYWEPNIAWGPQGDLLYVSATDDPLPDLLTNRIYTVGISDGQMQEFARPHGGFGQLQVTPDGKMLSYLGARGEAFEADDLFVLPLSGGPARNLTGSSINRRLWGYEWLPDGRVMVQALWGLHSRFFLCSLDGKAEPYGNFDVPASGHYSYSKAFAAIPGTLVFVGERAHVAPELWMARAPGRAEKISSFNREWDEIPLTPMEAVRFASFDGMEIEAGLLKPAGYQEGQRIPLVILTHGGPSAKYSDNFQPWAQMLTSQGIAVLCPNIRGSTGYGYEFLVSNRYDWGGADFKDVLAAADHVIGLGVADPDRLGIGGWSYGGYMSAWAITQTTRFKAAAIGAPMTDLVSMYGASERWSHSYDTWYLGTPYENRELFNQRSPITFVQNARTPTLLLVGEKDENTPLFQCLEFLRGLQRHGVEAKLAVYTGAAHFPGNTRQQLDVHERFVGWFVEHLLTRQAPD